MAAKRRSSRTCPKFRAQTIPFKGRFDWGAFTVRTQETFFLCCKTQKLHFYNPDSLKLLKSLFELSGSSESLLEKARVTSRIVAAIQNVTPVFGKDSLPISAQSFAGLLPILNHPKFIKAVQKFQVKQILFQHPLKNRSIKAFFQSVPSSLSIEEFTSRELKATQKSQSYPPRVPLRTIWHVWLSFVETILVRLELTGILIKFSSTAG